MVYGELGGYPLCVAVKKKIIRYWGKLAEGKDTKINRVMYLLNLYNAGVYASP